MKRVFYTIVFIFTIAVMNSCEKDEGKLPSISFKTGGSYLSSDVTIAPDSNIVIGINAAKTEDEDVLKKFNISKIINGGTATTVFSKDLSGSEGDNYSYDYSTTTDTTHGQACKFIFTITNRDGLTNQVSLTVTNN